MATEPAGFFPRHVYEPPGKKSRFRSFRDAYGVYGVWLILSALLASLLGFCAYRLDPKYFWFHAYLELAISSLMLILTVIFVERVLEYRREQERKERWSIIRNDTFQSLGTILDYIVQSSVEHFLDGTSTGVQHTSSVYRDVEQDLVKKGKDLEKATDPEEMQAWAHKITAWHNTLAPVFNMLRTVTVPNLRQSTSNRTLLRIVLGLESDICHGAIFMSDLGRHPRVIAINVTTIAVIVRGCALIQWYLEQAKIHGVKDIDDWTNY